MSAVYRLTTSLDACLQCGVQWNLCLALKTALVALRAFETLAPLSERCIVHILHRAAHIPWALLWDVAFKAGQCSARLWHCPKSWKGICGIFPILPQCSVSFDSQGGGGDNQGGRSWQPVGESKKCLQFFRQACICKYMGTLFYIFLK